MVSTLTYMSKTPTIIVRKFVLRLKTLWLCKVTTLLLPARTHKERPKTSLLLSRDRTRYVRLLLQIEQQRCLFLQGTKQQHTLHQEDLTGLDVFACSENITPSCVRKLWVKPVDRYRAQNLHFISFVPKYDSEYDSNDGCHKKSNHIVLWISPI